MNKSHIKMILKILVSVTLLYIIFMNLDIEAFKKTIQGANLSYYPLIAFLIIANYVSSSFRWKILLGVFDGIEKIPLMTFIKLYFIGAFFNNFLPTSVGGDFYKAFRLGKKINNQSQA